MPTRYFEDFAVGDTIEAGSRLVTRDDIVAFASRYDPQPMHLDDEAARNTMLGGLGASGWHTCAVMMRVIADGFLADVASMGSPGIDEVKWVRPVRPGDRLSVRGTIRSVRASRSKPDRGFVLFFWEVTNAHGETVLTMLCPQMLGRRNAGHAA